MRLWQWVGNKKASQGFLWRQGLKAIYSLCRLATSFYLLLKLSVCIEVSIGSRHMKNVNLFVFRMQNIDQVQKVFIWNTAKLYIW